MSKKEEKKTVEWKEKERLYEMKNVGWKENERKEKMK